MEMPEITPCFVTLLDRGRITVSGIDSFKFLQNIVTNDLSKIGDASGLHACLLTAQGKYLHDFYIFKNGEDFIIDCEGGNRLADLLRRLTFYKLRAKISFDTKDDQGIYILLPENIRVLQKPDRAEKDYSIWNEWRIKNFIANGSRDAEIEKSTLAELNMEDAIDYNKGCYVGQELTARIHHRGLSKKHLYPVKFRSSAPPSGTSLTYDGNTIGEMRSSQGNIGLALLKNDLLPLLQDGFYMLD